MPASMHALDSSAGIDLAGIESNRLYTYVEMANFAGLDGTDEQKYRRVRRWVEDGKLGFTPLPGGRGRRIAGWQWIEYVRNSAVAAVR